MKALKLLLIGGLYALMPLFTYAQGANVSSPPLTGDQVPLNQPGHIIDLGDSLFVVGGSSTSYLINDASQSGTLHTQSDLQDQLNLAYLTARSQGSNGETTFYLFSQAFKTSFTGKASTPELVLGGFLEDEAHAIDPELVSATNKENANDSQVSLTSITVSWASVSNAEGYLLFRYDNRNPAINAFDTPYQVLEGQQATRYTDDDLTIGSSYTYYVMAYGVTRGNRFLSPAVGVAGNTLNLSFTANALTEARVQFSFQVDHYTFLQQVNEALYVIIQDKESDRVMHEELLSLSHIRSEELLFDHALMLSGNGTQGVFLTPSIESDLSHWTLELWLNPQREANGKMSLFESGDGLSVELDASGYLVAEKGQESLTSTVAVSNRWNHLAFSSKDGQLSFYLNGSLIGSGDFTAGPLTPSMSIGKFNGQIGLVRMWSKARSAEQVEADYMDIFLGQPHQFLDLHGQWRFEDKNSITSSIDDISQKQLAIASTNPGTYPLLIDASNFDGGVKTYVAQVWLEHPTTAGSHRIKDYLVQLFEEGTGRRLSVESDTTQFPQPAAPIVTLNQQQAGPFKVKITIDPVTPTGTLTADQYEVRRARLAGNEATNEIVLGTYPIDRSTGSPSSIEVEDAYAYDNPNTLGGGNQYQYTVIPRYDNTLVTKRDTANALTTGPEEVPDIQLQASGTDQVLVSWQPGGWQYDHLILERDNEILSNISGKDYLEDSLVLNGQPYEYKIVALKDGLPAFEQRTNFSIAPNGVFKGYLLTGDDYVLPNATFKVMGAGESIETLTNANGAFQVSELFYGKQANFKATMEGDTLDHDFELSYAEPAIHQALVNTSITPYQAIDSNTDFVTFQQPVVEHNAVTYAWTKIDETREVYINVYQKNEQRQSQLIRVIPPGGENRIRLYDGGTQEVRFVAYYFLLGGDAVVKQEYEATVTNQVHADVTLSAKVTTEQLLSLDWSYPASDTVDHFVVKRMQLSTDNGVDNTSYTVGQLPQQPADSLYQVLDISGHPNTTYYYVLEMMTRSGELLSVDTLEYTYPSPGQVIHTINAQNHNRYKIKLEEDRIHDRSWQGISVRVVDEVTGETLQEALLSKDLVVNGNEILYYHPQDAAQPGTSLEFQPFKQEVYVNTAKSEAFKATRVAKSSQLPDQLTPSPTTTNELQVPVPYASKDARNQVFLSWTYPDYTDVTFKVEKTRWTEGWTPGDWDGNNPDYPVERFTLPGNRRSLVDTTHAGTSIAGDTVIYRIMAEFHKIDEEGAITETFYSDWAADHGVARRYHQVGGHVFNAKGTPQPFVWVGIGDQWTLSDAAGHYILNDLELSGTSIRIDYVEPGATVITHRANLSIDPTQQVHTYDVELSGSNEFWELGTAPGSRIVGLAIESDPVTLTNKVRWMVNGERYSGSKVYNNLQAESIKADIKNGQSLLYVDSLTSNNPASADYVVETYLRDAIDKDHTTGMLGNAFNEWAVFDAPKYAEAFADQKNGWVELHFSHVKRNVDGFIILRGEEVIGEASANANYFRDVTGVPGQIYPYTIYSYIVREGQKIQSLQSSATVSAEYPAPGRVLNFSVEETLVHNAQGIIIQDSHGNDVVDNSLTLSWQYPDDEVAINGVRIFRDSKQIAMLDTPDSVFIDEKGVPETYTPYAIQSYDYREGEFHFGKTVEMAFNYPRLQQPVDLTLAGYQGELNPGDQVFDSLEISWKYYASAIDGFDLTIREIHLDQEVVSEFIAWDPDQTEYAFIFSEGYSEVDYEVILKARSTREDYTYYSEEARGEIGYDKLPAPFFTVNEQVNTLDGNATLNGKKVPLSWGFENPENLDYDGLLLTVTYQDGAVYTYNYVTLGQQNTIEFDSLELSPGQDRYDILMNPGITNQSFKAAIQAYQLKGAEKRLSEIEQLEFTVVLDSANKYPTNVTATQNQPSNVTLNWDYMEDEYPTRFIIYRDGIQIHMVVGDVFGFTDMNANPGVSHLYEVAAKYESGDEYKTPVRGHRLGSGSITAKVMSEFAVPIAGVEFRLSSTHNGLSYFKIETSDHQGNVTFDQLAINAEGIDYTVQPTTNLEHYQVRRMSASLNHTLPQNNNLIFINDHQRTISGLVKNKNCSSGCGHDNVSVALFLKQVSQQTTVNLANVATDKNGKFNFSVPYDLSTYDSLYIEVGNTRVDASGQSIDSIFFDYLPLYNNTLVTDAVGNTRLRVNLLDAVKEQEHLELVIEDRNSFPLNLEVTGPGECEVLSDYEFLLNIYDDDDKMKTQVWTVDQRVDSMLLPPYNHHIEIIDVNKKDRFSATLLDYFRSRGLYLDDNITNFKWSVDSVELGDSLRSIVNKLRYNERSTLLIDIDDPGVPGKQLGCGEYDLVMTTDEDASNRFYHALTLTVKPQQTINGITCDVTSGYIVPKFSGGEWANENIPGADRLAFDPTLGPGGSWQSLKLTAKAPNMHEPYTQLLEIYFYDDYGSFQGSRLLEILVLGDQSVDGKDVFFVPNNPNDALELLPLYVLRDPPGDNSSSFIREKSQFGFGIESKYSHELEGNFSHDDYLGILGIKGNYGVAFNTAHSVDNSLSLETVNVEFKESISTVKKAIPSENLEGYLDGPDADIVVGLNMIMSYGLLERLYLDGCDVKKTKQLKVDPNRIESTWVYTRSQIKNTVNYYRSLLKVDADNEPVQGNDGYQFREGVALDEENVANGFSVNDIGKAYQKFKELELSLDSRFTPACEMCEYVQSGNGDVYSELQDHCEQLGIMDENGQCQTLSELTRDWSQAQRNQYNEAYMKYNQLLESENDHVNVDYSSEGLESISFEAVENVTFGAGAVVSRTFEREEFTLGSSEKYKKYTLSTSIGGKTKYNQGWVNGFGLGSYIFLATPTEKAFETESSTKWVVTYEKKRSDSNSDTELSEFKTGFTLNDDDDGDHFSVDIFHASPNSIRSVTPYFSIYGGRSSCPYEPGTIPRDLPRIQLTDETGELWPTKYYDLHPDQAMAIPIALSSGNQFDERRLAQVTVPLGTNKKGLNMEIENVKVNNYRGSVALVQPADPGEGDFPVASDGNYYTYLVADRGGLPFFEFDDIELVVKPNCYGGKGTYWEDEAIYDTLKLEFHFQKPISPAVLSTDNGTWLVNTEEGRNVVPLKLTGYDVRQQMHSFREIYLEYKRRSDQHWTRLSESERGYSTLDKDLLWEFYEKNLNTYQDPTFPVLWDPEAANAIDGEYLIRATVVHDNGTTGVSNEVTGVIDTKPPTLAGPPEPVDGLYSLGDNISIAFDESIDCDKFLAESDLLVDVRINGEEVPYSIICDGSAVSILLDETVIAEYDGQNMEVQVLGIYDLNNNPSEESSYLWDFQLDYQKQTPSGFEAVSLSSPIVNASSPSELLYQVLNYDVYEKSGSIRDIRLAYRKENTTGWTEAYMLTKEHLLANYQALGDNSLVPSDTLRLHVGQFLSNDIALEDGVYDVQLVLTGSSGLQNVQSMPSITIDRVAPALLGIPAPADGVYDPGDEVVLGFDETVDCGYVSEEHFFSEISVPGSLVTEPFVPVRYHCAGDQLLVFYDESQFNEKLGRTVKVGIKEVRDLAGNKTDSLYHEFTVAQFGKSTSPASLLEASTNWVVNVEKPSVTFTIAEYDLFEQHYSLDSMILQFSGDKESWDPIETVTRDQLRIYFENNGGATANNYPVYPINWIPPVAYQDTVLEVRAKVFGEGFPKYSDMAEGRIDRISPVVQSSSPSDGTIHMGTMVMLSFSEDMDTGSLDTGAVSVGQVMEGDGSASRMASTYEVDPAMYTTFLDGNTLEILFDDHFTSQYAGEQLELKVAELRDLNGNALAEDVEEFFTVLNLNADGTEAAIRALDFEGEQLASGPIQLDWNNVSEDIVHYELERSSNGQKFTPIATVTSQAVERYTYEDLVNFEEAIYYRLKLYDQQGTHTRSKVVMITNTGIEIPQLLEVYPNPVNDDRILRFAVINTSPGAVSKVMIMDLSGVVLMEEEIETMDKVYHQVQLDKSMSPGVYMLNVEHPGFNNSIRFIIE